MAEYNKNPFDLSAAKISFTDLYHIFMKQRFPNWDEKTTEEKDTLVSSYNSYAMAYNHSETLYDIKFVEVRKAHLQEVIDNCPKGQTKIKIKTLYSQMYKVAMENDIVDKDYEEFVDIASDDTKSSRKPFTAAEIKLLRDNIDKIPDVDVISILIYTGMRPAELLKMENANINIEERYMRGDVKNKHSKNRVIPLNKNIVGFVEKRMTANQYLLVGSRNKKMDYQSFRNRIWNKVMKELELVHLPHDSRHTFATIIDRAGADKLSIKRIMGHASKDITDGVYTHKDIEDLLKAVDLLE
ncbi:tyrosine-type recombinase/integrase [Bacillus sp. FSL K6-3431]|uniref:tyrosine-type recombinase/integrase n=1 Tax=Bacillus sp. FSL K6-3431 TaxID=2921500 RepID=UPI0030F4D598